MDELDRIERYLSNQLSPHEQIQFEKQLQEDPELALNVKRLQLVSQQLRTAHIEQRAQNTLQQLYRQNRTRTIRLTYFGWASGGLLAACLAGLIYLLFIPIQLPELGDDLLRDRAASTVDTLSSDSSSVYAQLLAGQRAYQRGAYGQAIVALERVVATPDVRPYYREAAQWYLVAAYLSDGQPQRAEQYYHNLQQLKNPVYPIGTIDRLAIYAQLQRAR